MKPDFESLRAERNAAMERWIDEFCEKHGQDRSQEQTSFDPEACYCACATGGPCEHDFQGWRDFEDGSGGERICARCGLGAMSHSLRTAP